MPRIRLATAISVLCILGSCKSTGAPPPSQDDGVTAIQFQDIVVPAGMNLVDRFHESNSAEEAGWRFGHFVYSGQTHLEDACEHVRQRMKEHSWQIVADEPRDETTHHFKFVRGRYVSDYTLRRQDGITHMVIDYRTEIQSR